MVSGSLRMPRGSGWHVERREFRLSKETLAFEAVDPAGLLPRGQLIPASQITALAEWRFSSILVPHPQSIRNEAGHALLIF